MALWQAYGFCHGVLNTDNISVLGLTIDYGPFAWMEQFDPNFICNHSDKGRGRYRFNSQPEICQWNLIKLCEALDPIVPLDFSTEYVMDNYKKLYDEFYFTKMAQRLGLIVTKPPTAEELSKESGTRKTLIANETPRELRQEEKELIENFILTLQKTGSDYTDTFRVLGNLKVNLLRTDSTISTQGKSDSISSEIGADSEE